MTDRIDLDDIDTDEEEPDDEPNRGDWFWRDEGDPADEPDDPFGSRSVREATADAGVDDPAATEGDDPDHAATPRVPRQGDDKPVGIPIEGGGAGSSPAADRPAAEGGVPEDDDGGTAAEPRREATGAAPHGEDADDMTMALTYRAATRLTHPASAFADAEGWADWIGIVGRVETPVINRFQRQNGVDADFFSGTGTGPGERLAEIGPRSMFYAKRMVVVGVEGEDERVAAEADWEFVPLTEAAEKADWALDEE
jgi:hypothetical protein